MRRTTPLVALAIFAVVSSRPASTAPPPSPLAEPSRQEIEDFLRRAEVVARERLPIGVTNSHKLTLSDGGRTISAVWKVIDDFEQLKHFDRGPPEIGFRDSYRSEVAAYELDKLLGLGMVPPTVERTIDGEQGSLQLWMEGCMTEVERRKRGLEPPDPQRFNGQIYKYRLFHQLVHDTDYRNSSNLLVDRETFDIWVIDESRAFRTHGVLLNRDYLSRFSRPLLERLRALERSELEARLGPWLTRGQIQGLLKRRDLIVAHAEVLIAERGEPAVLY